MALVVADKIPPPSIKTPPPKALMLTDETDRKSQYKQRSDGNEQRPPPAQKRSPYQPPDGMSMKVDRHRVGDARENPQGKIQTNPSTGDDNRNMVGNCEGCGLRHPNPRVLTARGWYHKGCQYYYQRHPDYNKEECSFVTSKIGRAYAALGQRHLVPHQMLDATGKKLIERSKKRKSEAVSGMTTSYTLKSYILPGTVSYRDGNAIAVRVELDTATRVGR